MAQINLTKGLRAYWTMDNADYDSQRNLIRDRSGYGNHMSLTGGTGTGAASPVGQATTHDGVDDIGDTELKDREYLSGGYTWGVLFRCDPSTAGTDISILYHNGGTRLRKYSDDLYYHISNDTGNAFNQLGLGGLGVGNWIPLVLSVNVGGKWRSIVGDTVRDMEDRPNDINETGNTFRIHGNFNGEVGALGIWDRGLTVPEAKAWNRMTARRVAQL